MENNLLFKGDNLKSLQWLIDNGYEGKIDLVYIDPPFATGRKFCIGNGDDTRTISSGADDPVAYEDTLVGDDFLSFLKERVELIHKLLSERGSFYLHTDCKYSHYIKVMLDGIFGRDNFRNDITRIKCNPKNFNKIGYGNIKDVVLFYTKGKAPIWNDPEIAYDEDGIKKAYPCIDEKGRRYTTVPIHAPGECATGETSKPFRGMMPPKGRHWRCSVEKLEELDKEGLLQWSPTGNPRKIIYADEHTTKKMQDIWDFKDPTHPIYPTEKNMDMMEYIVRASSLPGSYVLDAFCGSGTTIYAASTCGRHWIGMDESDVAIRTIEKRFGLDDDYEYIEIKKED